MLTEAVQYLSQKVIRAEWIEKGRENEYNEGQHNYGMAVNKRHHEIVPKTSFLFSEWKSKIEVFYYFNISFS